MAEFKCVKLFYFSWSLPLDVQRWLAEAQYCIFMYIPHTNVFFIEHKVLFYQCVPCQSMKLSLIPVCSLSEYERNIHYMDHNNVQATSRGQALIYSIDILSQLCIQLKSSLGTASIASIVMTHQSCMQKLLLIILQVQSYPPNPWCGQPVSIIEYIHIINNLATFTILVTSFMYSQCGYVSSLIAGHYYVRQVMCSNPY